MGLVDRVRSVRPIGMDSRKHVFQCICLQYDYRQHDRDCLYGGIQRNHRYFDNPFMGALSDKVGKRKIFICAGYIIWGFTTFAFSLITVHNTSVLFPAANAVMLAGVFVVIMDCVMTFFGSTANDAAFNAWITDVTEPQNRGKTETVLAIMPLLAMVVVFGALAPLTMQGKWTLFLLLSAGSRRLAA